MQLSKNSEASIVFYKIYSDLGITNKPNGQKERNDGVYFGPDAVLDETFIQSFPNAKIHEFRFSRNTEVPSDALYRTLEKESALCRDHLLAHLRERDTLIAVGGDNSITFPVLLSDRTRYDRVGIISFDTHGDIHLQKDSPTGNFHGLYMRPFFDTFDIPEIDALVPTKLQSSDLLYVGNFDFEKEETAFMDTKRIRRFSGTEIKHGLETVIDSLEEFLSLHSHIHINFDVDVFDASLVTATGIPNKEGLLVDEVFPLLERIRIHPSKTISLSEVNPEKAGIAETVYVAQAVLRALA